MDTLIEITNLTHIFSKHIALKDINLTIPHSTFVSIVGPNGGGKTTLLKCMLGLIQPTYGTVLIDGQVPKKTPASKFGYIPQIKTLDRTFPAYSIELVATGLINSWPNLIKRDIYNKCCDALDSVGAKHLERRQLNELSGGELQRIYFARSIVRKPKILILDEPATGIDITVEKDMDILIDEYSLYY